MEHSKTKDFTISGMILEGISGSGKSTALQNILLHPTYCKKPYLTSLIFSEHHTQRILEKKDHLGTLCPQDHLDLLQNLISPLKTLHQGLTLRKWDNMAHDDHKITYIFERFHLTHVTHYTSITWDLMKETDTTLAELGAKLCICVVDENTLNARLFSRTTPCWRRYLSTFGDTDTKILDHFLLQQAQLITLSKSSSLSTLILDTSNKNPTEVAEEILSFWSIF